MAHRGATEGPLGHDPAWGHLDLRLAVPRIRRVTAEDYLAAYDAQLRTEAETPSAISVTELGPLRLATFAGGRGFVTYRDLGGTGAETIAEWVEQAAAHYRADPHVRHVEWKTRGHDRAPGLHICWSLPEPQPEQHRGHVRQCRLVA